ncbi:OsmC family peroxiredoxin [Georgenia sp. 311]|uniref:OsmC family peroxiredoxin n=1 Tax=Georgenia wutianyii TaxID=2585135 RepID=A0ABX5VMY6_9MICO|nr:MULTISPECIES: OsmC family protein [Georgenia]QDB79318.1 OsmC family peroxiredoxin [Georgenia wutianyii]TNC17398.1 OsmC family peroxiredoxin [Georgenia sp. 311]
MGALHTYTVTVDWTGADEVGTRSYTSYSRDHEVRVEGKPTLLATSDRKVASDVARYKAEELFVGAVSQAQMLWFLRTAAAHGVVVVGYTDVATATERVEGSNSGPFSDIVLRPRVTYAQPISDEAAARLHEDARAQNHIVRSLACPVRVQPAPPAVEPNVG